MEGSNKHHRDVRTAYSVPAAVVKGLTRISLFNLPNSPIASSARVEKVEADHLEEGAQVDRRKEEDLERSLSQSPKARS